MPTHSSTVFVVRLGQGTQLSHIGLHNNTSTAASAVKRQLHIPITSQLSGQEGIAEQPCRIRIAGKLSRASSLLSACRGPDRVCSMLAALKHVPPCLRKSTWQVPKSDELWKQLGNPLPLPPGCTRCCRRYGRCQSLTWGPAPSVPQVLRTEVSRGRIACHTLRAELCDAAASRTRTHAHRLPPLGPAGG
jgi:hypothetical protein